MHNLDMSTAYDHRQPCAEAHTVRCDQCGGGFAIARVREVVTCPFCGTRQRWTEHGELRAYENAVRSRVAAADEQHMVAASLEAWTASAASSPARNLAVAYGLMLGLPLALAAVLGLLHAAGALEGVGPGAALAIGGVGYAGLFGWMVWRGANRARGRRRATPLAGTRVACPTCSAPGSLTPGRGVDTCEYCDSALVPTPTMRQRGLDAARAAEHAAALERKRATRRATARAADVGPFGIIMPILIVGGPAAMIAVTAIGYTVQMIRGAEPFHPGIFALWALTVGGVSGLIVFLARRRQRRARLYSALGDVARQLGGSLLPTTHDRVQWLNANWSGDYDERHLVLATSQSCAAHGFAGGYSMMIEVELSPSKPAPRVELYLPAWDSKARAGQSRRVRDRALSELGFFVHATEGGLVARAHPELLSAARRDPDVVHVAATAAARLAHLAAARGFDHVV